MELVFVLVFLFGVVHSQTSFQDQMLWQNMFQPLANLYDCQNPHKVAYYKTNVEINLCCTSASNETSLAINKVDFGTRLMPGWILTNGGTSSVRLTIPSPQKRDSGMYACYSNITGKPINKLDITFIDPVDAPHIISVITTVMGKLTIKFETGQVSDVMADVYIVTKEPGGYVLCTNRSISCRKEKCTCSHKLDAVKDRNVTIVVTKRRAVQEIEANQTLNLIQHIKPSHVTELKVYRKDSRSARLRFCSPRYAFLVIYAMKERNEPLGVSVTLTKTQGFYEERKFKVFFKNSDLECLWVSLLTLTPFTRYNLSVTAFGGGGNSAPWNAFFTTKQEVPLSPPKDISYWMVEDKKENNGSLEVRNSYSVIINWKPLPHDENGGQVFYEITVSDYFKRNLRYHQGNTTKAFTIVRNVPDSVLFVKIYAANEKGRSKNFSSVVVERYSENKDINQLESHAEIDGNKGKFFIEKPETPVKISAIHWCVGHQDSQSGMPLTCKEYPQIISSFSENGDFDQILIHAVGNLGSRECPTKISLVAMNARSNFYQFKSKLSSNTPSLHSEDITVNVFRNETTSCPIASSTSVELNLLKMNEYIEQGIFHKFMFSVERQGERSPRLFPFKCYYDNKYDYARLDIHENFNRSNILLRWKQYCDSNLPHQFLAQKYHIYMSKDNKCQPSGGAFETIDNKIVQFSKYVMPQQNAFACIKIFKSSEDDTSLETISHEVNEANVLKDHNHKLYYLFFLICLLILPIVMAVWCHRKRVNRLKIVHRVFDNIPNPWKVSEEKPKQSRIEPKYVQPPEIENCLKPWKSWLERPQTLAATYHFKSKDSALEDGESGISSASPENENWDIAVQQSPTTTETIYEEKDESGFGSGSSRQISENSCSEENSPDEEVVLAMNAVDRHTDNPGQIRLLSVQERLQRELHKQIKRDV